MKHHELKLNTEFWDPVMRGEKSFEVRINDRGFQKGDMIRFMRKDVVVDVLNPSPLFEITYVLSGWGIKEDYVVFGIKQKTEATK